MNATRCIHRGCFAQNFCVGNSLSIADLAVWRLMGWLSSGVIDDISPNLVEPFDAIMNICRRVESLPKVVEWIIPIQLIIGL